MAASNQDYLTKEELEAIDYQHLLTMDKNYSFKTRSKTRSTRKTKDAIIQRLLKHRVTRSKYKSELGSYLKYELEHPIAKALPSGTSIPPYLVSKIYTMKKEIEDREYEIEFLKPLFEASQPPKYYYGAFFNLLFNERRVSLTNISPSENNAVFYKHFNNLYSPDYFIKDYGYLVQRFGLNADKLREKRQYIDTKGIESGRYGDPNPSKIPNAAIFDSYAQFKEKYIAKFFNTHVLAAYTMIIIINTMLQKVEDYRTSHIASLGSLCKRITRCFTRSRKGLIYPEDEAYTLMRERYERYLPGNANIPINVLKVYISGLNKMLLLLRGYKIILNPKIIKELNKRLTSINDYLAPRNPSIVGQPNAQFKERVLESDLEFSKKPRSYTPRKKLKLKLKSKLNNTTQKRAKSV